jgi:hypothetical protein
MVLSNKEILFNGLALSYIITYLIFKLKKLLQKHKGRCLNEKMRGLTREKNSVLID